MYLRYFFFLLFFLISTNRALGQELRHDFITAVNNPFAETVRPVFEYESGKLVLKLTNGFREKVVLNQVELGQAGLRSSKLLKTPVDICPAEAKYIQIEPTGIDMTQQFRVVLHLAAKPPKQKSEFVFRFEEKTSQVVEVEAEKGP